MVVREEGEKGEEEQREGEEGREEGKEERGFRASFIDLYQVLLLPRGVINRLLSPFPSLPSPSLSF